MLVVSDHRCAVPIKFGWVGDFWPVRRWPAHRSVGPWGGRFPPRRVAAFFFYVRSHVRVHVASTPRTHAPVRMPVRMSAYASVRTPHRMCRGSSMPCSSMPGFVLNGAAGCMQAAPYVQRIRFNHAHRGVLRYSSSRSKVPTHDKNKKEPRAHQSIAPERREL